MAPKFKLPFKNYGTFHFRVNCAITNADDNLEVMVVDIGYEERDNSNEIIPAQQVVVKGTWTDGKLTDAVSDLSDINHTARKLDEQLIGDYVSGMLRSIAKVEKSKKPKGQQNPAEDISQVVIVVPDSYSAGIN